MNSNINGIDNRQGGELTSDYVQAEESAPQNMKGASTSGCPDPRTPAGDAAIIRRALAKLRASPGQAQWIARLPWRIGELVEARPYNLYYKLRRSPFPSQIVEYSEQDQMCSMKVWVHSVHSPRVVFGVQASELQPYR